MSHSKAPYNDLIMALTGRLLGAQPVITRLASEVNYVARLSFPDAALPDSVLPDAVLKLAVHQDVAVRQEQRWLRRLADAGIAVPAILFTQDDIPDPPMTFTLMPSVGTTDLQERCNNDAPHALDICRAAGGFLKRLHEVDSTAFVDMQEHHYAGRTPFDVDAERWVASLTRLGVAPLQRFADRFNALVSCTPAHVVHDTFHATHVRCDDSGGLWVIDWETARIGYPLRDVACFLLPMYSWGPADPDRYAAALLDGFTGGAGLDELALEEADCWEISYRLLWGEAYVGWGRPELAERMWAGAETLLERMSTTTRQPVVLCARLPT